MKMDKWIEEARNNANPNAVLYIVTTFIFLVLLPNLWLMFYPGWKQAGQGQHWGPRGVD